VIVVVVVLVVLVAGTVVGLGTWWDRSRRSPSVDRFGRSQAALTRANARARELQEWQH
jgi:hypothetical protein